jgi:hypothetical protein
MTIEEKHWLVNDMNIAGIDQIEQQESTALNSIVKIIKEYFNQDSIEEKIKYLPKFREFYQGGRGMYWGNFNILKRFLHKLYYYLFEEKKSNELNQLHIKLDSWKIPFSSSKNISEFNNYIFHLRKRLLNSKPIQNDVTIKIDSENVYYTAIVEKVRKKISSNNDEQISFASNALLFYREPAIHKDKLKTQKDWEDALLNFHNSEQKLFNPKGYSYDERKVYSKKKKSDPSYGD